MKLKIAALLTVVTFSSNCASASSCSQPVHLLEENAPADCRGYLMSPEKEQEVRLKVEDYDLVKQENDILNKEMTTYKYKEADFDRVLDLETQKTELWKTKAEDATEKLVKNDNKQLLYILEGIGLTVLAAWAVGQVRK